MTPRRSVGAVAMRAVHGQRSGGIELLQ